MRERNWTLRLLSPQIRKASADKPDNPGGTDAGRQRGHVMWESNLTDAQLLRVIAENLEHTTKLLLLMERRYMEMRYDAQAEHPAGKGDK